MLTANGRSADRRYPARSSLTLDHEGAVEQAQFDLSNLAAGAVNLLGGQKTARNAGPSSCQTAAR